MKPAVEPEPQWDVLAAAPGGRVLRRSCAPERDAVLADAITRHGARDGAWTEPLADDWIAHGMGRLGHVVVIATPRAVSESEVRGYLEALLTSYGARPIDRRPPDPGSGPSGAPALIAAYTPPRRVS